MAAGMGDRNELIQSVYFDVVVLLTRFERYDESIDMLQRMLRERRARSGAYRTCRARRPALASFALRGAAGPGRTGPSCRRAVLDVQTQHYENAEIGTQATRDKLRE